MFTKNSLASISGFLDLARVPLRSAALLRDFGSWRMPREARVFLLRDAGVGGPGEELIFQGDPQAGPGLAEVVLARGERIVAEGFSFEAITTLCERHNYRWRLRPARNARIRFMLEPAPATTEGSTPRT